LEAWLDHFAKHVQTSIMNRSWIVSVAQAHKVFDGHIATCATLLSLLGIVWTGKIVVIMGLQDVKGQVTERQEQGIDHLDLTLQLGGLQAFRSMYPKEDTEDGALSQREATLWQKLRCQYNRNLAQVIMHLLLSGVIIVLGEVFPLHFHGDAGQRTHG
jgi:hypothetical protein